MATTAMAGDVTGPYTNVPSANSPYVVAPAEAKRFYRVKVQ